MRPIGLKFGSLPGLKGKRTTRTERRWLLVSVTIGSYEIFRFRIEQHRKRTIPICTKSGAKIQTFHSHQAATHSCSKASPTISVLQVRSLIPNNAWSDW